MKSLTEVRDEMMEVARQHIMVMTEKTTLFDMPIADMACGRAYEHNGEKLYFVLTLNEYRFPQATKQAWSLSISPEDHETQPRASKAAVNEILQVFFGAGAQLLTNPINPLHPKQQQFSMLIEE
jgi:hypothetical protein